MPLNAVYHEPKGMAEALVQMGAASYEEVKEKQETAPAEKQKQVTPTPKKKK